MKKAECGEISLLFLDASHFVMGCDFLGHIYGKARRYVRTFSGRRRYNVLGALDYISKKMLTVANDSYITATEVCDMLYKVAAEYSGKKSILCLTMQGIKNVVWYRSLPASWISSLSTYRHTVQTLI